MKTILVPIDFSENSINALKYADTLSLKLNAHIIILNVYVGDITNYDVGWPMEESFVNVKENLAKDLKEIGDKYCKSETTILLKEGLIVTEIINAIEETKADLVVMGTHGATGLKRVFLGSNTAHIISNSNTPVLAIPENYVFNYIEKIIYATDMSNLESELKLVASAADNLNAAVEVLHLRHESEKDRGTEVIFNKALGDISYAKVTFTEKTIPIEHTLSSYLKSLIKIQKHAILAMFTEDKNWFERALLNSITDDMAYDLNLPLLGMRKPK